MSSFDDHRRDADAGGAASQPSEATSPSGAGDLEFDEAWEGAAAQDEGRSAADARDPNPTFEDPSER